VTKPNRQLAAAGGRPTPHEGDGRIALAPFGLSDCLLRATEPVCQLVLGQTGACARPAKQFSRSLFLFRSSRLAAG